jgi:hypothetical protein
LSSSPRTSETARRTKLRASGDSVRRLGCEDHGLTHTALTPVFIAGYVEHLGECLAKPSVKQQLAAIRILLDGDGDGFSAGRLLGRVGFQFRPR